MIQFRVLTSAGFDHSDMPAELTAHTQKLYPVEGERARVAS